MAAAASTCRCTTGSCTRVYVAGDQLGTRRRGETTVVGHRSRPRKNENIWRMCDSCTRPRITGSGLTRLSPSRSPRGVVLTDRGAERSGRSSVAVWAHNLMSGAVKDHSTRKARSASPSADEPPDLPTKEPGYMCVLVTVFVGVPLALQSSTPQWYFRTRSSVSPCPSEAEVPEPPCPVLPRRGLPSRRLLRNSFT